MKTGLLTGYVYLDLATKDYGGFVTKADRLLREKLKLPPGYTYKWSGEYEFELRAQERLKIILPVVFFVIFLLLYMVFHSVDGGGSPNLSHTLRHDGRSYPPVVVGLQLQRGCLGGLHRTVRYRGRNRSGHGGLSPRIPRQAPCLWNAR